MLMFSLIILTGISLPGQAFLLFSFWNSLNIFFLSINLKENDLPIISLIFKMLLDCTENWISNMGLGYIIPKIIAYVEIGYDFTNKYIIKRLS